MNSHAITIINLTCALPETTKSQERELRSLSMSLSKATEENSSLKKSHNQLEREKTRTELSLKSLQDKYEQLSLSHEETQEKMKEARRLSSSSSRESADYVEVLKKLEAESKAREEAVSRAEAAEQQCSMLKLDVKTSKQEVTQLKHELAVTRSKVWCCLCMSTIFCLVKVVYRRF